MTRLIPPTSSGIVNLLIERQRKREDVALTLSNGDRIIGRPIIGHDYTTVDMVTTEGEYAVATEHIVMVRRR